VVSEVRIRPRERDAIIQSLRAGVTPRSGLQHIQVGRAREVDSLLKDIDRIIEGGASFRLIIGDYGSGKSFFLQLMRTIALEKGLVTLHADLAPDRRLQASGGQARNLYAELMRNCSTRLKQDGGALSSVVEKFINNALREAKNNSQSVDTVIETRLHQLSELVGGYDFAQVIKAYWQGHESGQDQIKSDATRWLRGEFTSKLDARKALGVRSIVEDSDIYDRLKLFSLFVKQAGYAGLLINLDEMVNLYKLSSGRSRSANYEQILRMLNDCLQGLASHIGFLLGGTNDFLLDPRKGLYSYEALHSRLAENTFAQKAGVTDYSGPALRLASLTREELFILLRNIRRVFAYGDEEKFLVPDEALVAFLSHCENRIGEAYFRTPRNTIRAFADMLSLLEQNPEMKWSDLVDQAEVAEEVDSNMPEMEIDDGDDDQLTSFKL
jgi:energy-coupling factor transporter ATP-binding protein EcfA2